MSCIKRKLDTGAYSDPWEFVNDVFLMFENAWVYNRKTSRVYRYCSKVYSKRKIVTPLTFPLLQLAEVFEAEIDPVMQSLGFCCGRKHTYSPQVRLQIWLEQYHDTYQSAEQELFMLPCVTFLFCHSAPVKLSHNSLRIAFTVSMQLKAYHEINATGRNKVHQ